MPSDRKMTPYIEDLVSRLCDAWSEVAYEPTYYHEDADANFPLPNNVEKIELRDDGSVWIVWEGGSEEKVRDM